MEVFTEILREVHSNPSFENYRETNVRDNTNCYSHALGATFPAIELYRVGAISGKKPIDEPYKSIKEIKELLFLDCEKLQLKIEESSLEEEVSDNQYKIELFVKIWANGKIGDYHFLRLEDGKVTEKWRGREMNEIQDLKTSKMQCFPWNFAGIYKISK